MYRRWYLGAVVSGIGIVSAGCLSSESAESAEPGELVEEFFIAINDADADAANELLHSDSPEGELSEQDVVEIIGIDYFVTETETIEESDSTAVVQFELLMEAANPITDDVVEATNEASVELRKEDGEWRLYDVPEGELTDEMLEESLVLDSHSVEEGVQYVNDMIDHINENEESSLATFNELMEGGYSVEFIDHVEAETQQEAIEEAERLREDEPARLERETLRAVAGKVENATDVDTFDPDEITTVEDAEELADQMEEHSEVAADNILLAIDFVDFLYQILDLAAQVLENAEPET